MGATEPAARLNAVSRSYVSGAETITALDAVNLTIEKGSIVALCGPSGSGKSTLLQMLGGLDVADAGTVEVGGTELGGLSRRQLAAHRRRVGFVFQRFNLLPALTARENVIAPTLPLKKAAFDRRERADELLASVGLRGREDALPSELSGGQQQRVAIARALVNAPLLVLADEPTGSLDSVTGADVLELLVGLREGFGTTVVIATHDAGVAARCDRVVSLIDGRLVDDYTLAEPDLEMLQRRLGQAARP